MSFLIGLMIYQHHCMSLYITRRTSVVGFRRFGTLFFCCFILGSWKMASETSVTNNQQATTIFVIVYITFLSKQFFSLKMALIEPEHVAGSNNVKYTINPNNNY